MKFWYRNNIMICLKKAFSLVALVLIFLMSGLSSYFFFRDYIFADVTYPEYSSFVNDYTGTLDSGWKSTIENLCVKVESENNAEIEVAMQLQNRHRERGPCRRLEGIRSGIVPRRIGKNAGQGTAG